MARINRNVIVPEWLINRITAMCDVAVELDGETALVKTAKAIRAEIDKGLEYEIYTYKEMENAVHLSADLMEKLAEHDDKYEFEDMRARANFLIQKAVELGKQLGGKNEEEGDYDYVEELENFEKKILDEL